MATNPQNISGPALASQPEFGSDDWFANEAVFFHRNLDESQKAAERERLKSQLQEAERSKNNKEAEFISSLLSSIENSAAGVSREDRMARIAQYDKELESITVPANQDYRLYRGERMDAPKPEAPALTEITSMEQRGRKVDAPLIDPFSRTGQTFTAFEVGIKRQVGDYFKRKDDAVQMRDSLYEHVYSQLSTAEQERMKAPRYWGWQYDSYKNMPFIDFKRAVEKGGEFKDDDWRKLLGDDLYTSMMRGDDPMSEEAGGFYRHFVQPLLKDGELKPSDRMYQSVEKARNNWYTDATRKSTDKPFVAKDAKWYKPWSWFDETTKAPWEDWDGFYYSVAENTPQLTAGFVTARFGGGLGSRLSALQKVDKAEDLIKLQRTMATAGGIIAGAGTEALMIRDNVYAETSRRVTDLPDEKFEDYPEYQQLVGAGYSKELAKQIIGFETGVNAGNTAMVISGLLMGSPMAAFFGRRAAGELGGVGGKFFTNMLKGFTGEAAQEGSQEAMEQFLGNLNVSYVDPSQSLTEGLGEAFAGGALVSAGPGALGSMEGGRATGFSKEQTDAIYAGLAVRRSIAERYKYEQEIATDKPGLEKPPKQRVEEYQQLERLQQKEAQTILDNEKAIRDFTQSEGGNDAELKMLNRLVAKANLTLADIAVAYSKRTTAAQQLIEEQEIQKERGRIEKAVSENLMKLDDVDRIASAIESVQNFEAIPEEQYEELRREGYGKWVGANQNKFVLLPKGRRALKELRRQSIHLQKKLREGYTGDERRKPVSDYRRQMVDAATPEQREELLYKDILTGVENRRAFNERAKEAKAVAAVDVDSLKWVNDNMGEHAAGDRLLMTVAEALSAQEGVKVYRFDGDEFAVTGESAEQIEAALQAAAIQLQEKPIRSGSDELVSTITWGKGATYEEADLEATVMKRERARSGKRAGRDKTPPSLKNVKQGNLLFQRERTDQYFRGPRVGWLKAAKKNNPDLYVPNKKIKLQVMGYLDSLAYKHVDPESNEARIINGTIIEKVDHGSISLSVKTENGSILHFNHLGHLIDLISNPIHVDQRDADIVSMNEEFQRNINEHKKRPSTKAVRVLPYPTLGIRFHQEFNKETSGTQGNLLFHLDNQPKKKLLVIHMKDETTDFLSKIYEDLKNDELTNVTVVSTGLNRKRMRQLLKSHDRVMMMGHGSPNGLFGTRGLAIDETMVDLLKEKDDSIYIWCHANEFCSKYDLKGFSTGMFVSEPGEARTFRVPATDEEIEASNKAFTEVMKDAVKLSSDQIYETVTREYGKTDSAVTKYNIEQMAPLPPQLASRWRDVRNVVERGDSVEIKTNTGTVTGVVTEALTQRKRQRLKVSVAGREFTFNPQRNWLIVNDMTDPADLAWITGDNKYNDWTQSLPQIVPTISITKMGRDGQWYADLSQKKKSLYEPYQDAWWADEYPDWHHSISYLPMAAQVSRDATPEEMAVALHVVNTKLGDFYNLPPIQLVDSLSALEKIAPETVAEARAMGVSFGGVHGFFDENRPDNGIVLIVPNISGKPGSDVFEMNITDTLMHELIGHYGVRGVFGQNNEELRTFMHEVVDTFPQVADMYQFMVPKRQMTDAEYKQMLGEEMIAYVTGEIMAGSFTPTVKQQNFLQRFFAWIRNWMVRRGWMKADTKTRAEAKSAFWNDERIRDLVARSTDYVRSAKVQTGQKSPEQTARFMRDMDIFRSGVAMVIESATQELSNSQRKQLAQKYGGKENVPREVPMFEPVGSPNRYLEVFKKLKKDNKVSSKELELAKLDPDGEWNFLQHSTYQSLSLYLPLDMMTNERWYRQVMPPNLADEMDRNREIAKNQTPTPVPTGADDATIDQLTEADAKKKLDAEDRINEILNSTIDQKRTQIPKEALLNFLKSDGVVRIYSQDVQKNPRIEFGMAARKLFGDKVDEPNFVSGLTPDQKAMIQTEVRLTQERGYDIGFNIDTQRWNDYTSRFTSYRDYSPHGSGTEDYRVTYLIQEGGGLRRGMSGHFDSREGVIAHIRSGLATIAELDDGRKLPDAPNPAMKSKALVMIELQSDWLQAARKGYASRDEMNQLYNKHSEETEQLNQLTRQFSAGLQAIIQTHVKELLKPATNLPSGSLAAELEAAIATSYPDGATQAQRYELYQQLRNERIVDLAASISKASAEASAYVRTIQDTSGIKSVESTMDERFFQKLDEFAVMRIASYIATDLTSLQNNFMTAMHHSNQEDFVTSISNAINTSMSRFHHGVTSADESWRLRLPILEREFGKMMVPVLRELGVASPDEAVANVMDQIKVIHKTSIRFPVEHIEKLIAEEGSKGRISFDMFVQDVIFSGENLETVGINSDLVQVKVHAVDGTNEYAIDVSAQEDMLKKFTDSVPELFQHWATQAAPSAWQRSIERSRRGTKTATRSTEEDARVFPVHDWEEIKDELNFEQIDVYGEQLAELNNYNVTGYYSYEEGRIGNAIEEAVISHMNDIDWNEVSNDVGEVLAEGSEAYESRVIVDEDGDRNESDADDWLETERTNYEQGVREYDSTLEAASDSVRSSFNDDPPMLWIGSLPVTWDEDGNEEDTVSIVVVQRDAGEYTYIEIDAEAGEGYNSKNRAFGDVATQIKGYYSDNEITPPDGSFFGRIQPEDQVATPLELEAAGQSTLPLEDGPKMPDFSSMAKELTAATYAVPSPPIKSKAIFESVVVAQKKIDTDGGIYPDSPISQDKYWRVTALKYLIADAVRRGIPAIVWHYGSSSTSRGGYSVDFKNATKLWWSVEEMDIRGDTREVLVIKSDVHNKPIVLTWDRALRVLGTPVIQHIQRQINGELPLLPSPTDPTVQREPSRDDFLVSRAGNRFVLHDRESGNFIGFFETQEEMNVVIDDRLNVQRENITRQNTEGDVNRQLVDHEIQVPQIGTKLLHRGEVTYRALGGFIPVALAPATDRYRHTGLSAPRTAGARYSYEVITKDIWNQELAKYDAKVGENYIKVDNLEGARSNEGAVGVELKDREAKIKERYGSLFVQEVTGQIHGWVAASETEGLITENIYDSRQVAQNYIDSFIKDNFGNASGAVKVFYIEVNDKMKEAFRGPVTPFHYDPRQDPDLKDAAEKIGYEPTKFRERFAKWREAWRDNFNQGMFDRFYGIKLAVNRAGMFTTAEHDPYIQARLTTSLDSVMKSVMEYGHPVWKDGIVHTEGKGLLDILQPVMEDIDLWGMYMAGVRAKRLFVEGRENLFTETEIDSMVKLGEKYPVFKQVAAQYAEFNKKVLDFAEVSGVINKDTRALWENADYVPFYRVQDERLVGPMAGSAGVANQRSPVRRLKGGEANVGNITHNILVNLTKLVDSSMKNHAALLAVDSLKDVGVISKKPMTMSQELIPLNQVKKLLIDRGMNPDMIPTDALEGLQKMFAIQPPEGEGVISILRNGKKEFYFTDDLLLYRALTAINKKSWGAWMNLLRAPKRLLTTLVTLDPGFMIANYIRDSLSAFVLSRDKFIPVLGGLKGLVQALTKDEAMRTMMSAGASFQNGYINQYDPKATDRLIKKAMKKKSFSRTLLTSPAKLLEAWKAIGSASENANRVAVYNAAIRAGKGKARAVYEAKDLMDFSMGGDWPFVQFLIQTVPFMGARMQGLQRLGRGALEHPVGFTMKGTLIGLAGLALWFAFKDDDRYKELEEWDKDVYFHFWIGDNHYRLPKPFEVGAIFNTIPERIFEYMYSKETDAGKLLMKRYGFMLAETFNMNPVPQTFRPMLESYFNYNFFTGRMIVSPYEEKRMPPEQYRYTTSPTMVEIARAMPGGIDMASEKIRSPLHLQNLYAGYTGTLGRYFLMASDAFLRQQLDYPLPPTKDISQYPVIGRFIRGQAPQRTKYEEEVYRLIDKTVAIQGSLAFLERAQLEERMEELLQKHEPYIRVADSLESIREDVSDINREIMNIYMDPEMLPDEKKKELDLLEDQVNMLFKEGYELRPGGLDNIEEPITKEDVINLIDQFGINDSTAYLRHLQEQAPDTYELLEIIRSNMEQRNVRSLARAKASNKEE